MARQKAAQTTESSVGKGKKTAGDDNTQPIDPLDFEEIDSESDSEARQKSDERHPHIHARGQVGPDERQADINAQEQTESDKRDAGFSWPVQLGIAAVMVTALYVWFYEQTEGEVLNLLEKLVGVHP